MNFLKKFLVHNPYIHSLLLKSSFQQHQLYYKSPLSIWIITSRKQKENSNTYKKLIQRNYCTVLTKAEQHILVHQYGDPLEVAKKEEFFLPSNLEKSEVIAKVLATSLNPSDINTIQGVYAIKPNFPFVPGSEAVMEIVKTGPDVTALSIGDRVIPKVNALGTWRSALVASEDKFIKIPSDINLITASVIAVNPCSAYRMLMDFVDLKAGDVVIQNCANSAVGQAIIQIAAAREIQTVNIVRQRPDFEELKSYLTSLGSTLVIADSELRGNKSLQDLPKPLLALNGVCGKSATEMMKYLANGGTMVTYGGMSRQPLTVGAGSLIFNNLTLRGFWMTAWNNLHRDDPERFKMLDYLFDLSRKGKFQCPLHDLIPFERYHVALEKAMPSKGMIGRKQILTFAQVSGS